MKYKYLILLIFLASGEAPAADSLGRLFMTPAQRAQLDVVRARRDPRQPITPESEPVAAAPAAPVPQGPDTVTYNGVVRRSDGKSTVWINGKAVDERQRIRGAHEVNVVGMRADGAVSVAIPQASRTASLRVGQRLDVGSGRVEESYGWRKTVPWSKENASHDSAVASPQIASPLAPFPVPSAASSEARSTRPTRPVHESYYREADSESGATPEERANTK